MKTTYDQYTIEVEPKKSITITREGKPSNQFFIGDQAEYDSYNLKYTGIIRSITEKTVTIEAYPGSSIARKYRLKLSEFAWRNWNFDFDRVQAENSETMLYI